MTKIKETKTYECKCVNCGKPLTVKHKPYPFESCRKCANEIRNMLKEAHCEHGHDIVSNGKCDCPDCEYYVGE